MSRFRVLSIVCFLLLGTAALLPAQEKIGFEEEFALTPDRAKALASLIPGTEEYYYYTCLYAQQKGDRDTVEKMLPLWKKRSGRTPLYQRIAHRQLLLDYSKNPQATLDEIRRELHLRFDYSPARPDTPPSWPTKLDPQLISTAHLVAEALAHHGGGLDGFTTRGLRLLADTSLDPNQRRALLSRLELPDYPDLVSRVVADLRQPHSSGFGSLPIHKQLLLDQLDAAVGLMPELIQNSEFIAAYIARLAPPAGTDLGRDRDAKHAYLERLVNFARRLPPSQNSLKAHALYHLLDFERHQGKYDRDLFLEYMKLPRPVGYMRRQYLQRRDLRGNVAQLSVPQTFSGGLPVIGDDWQLVRDYLLHFFVKDANYDAYAPYVRDKVLRGLFAEAKITHGIGDLEHWYSLLDDPAAYERLKERVDIDFAPTNHEYFTADEPVALDLDIKNVPSLIVKVFQINALNYYRELGHEIRADLPLDGLVADNEHTYSYSEASWLRVRRHFEFPQLANPGTYIVEFIGAGKGSRALIRKGRLRFTERIGAAGHVFHVFDDAGKAVSAPRLWLAGHEYEAGAGGDIVVPYTQKPGRQTIVISDGDGPTALATLGSFEHLAENYTLEAGFHIEREDLLAGKKARLLVRARLELNGVPVSLKLLEKPRLVIEAENFDGHATRQVVENFELFQSKESVHELRTPPELQSLQMILFGKVQNLSIGKKVDLHAEKQIALNGIDRTEKIDSALLARGALGYAIEVRGKTGEVRANQPVQVVLHHRDFKDPVTTQLQTDTSGRVFLGPLPGMTSLQTKLEGGAEQNWMLTNDWCRVPPVLQGRVGETLRVPDMHAGEKIVPQHFALFATRGSRDGGDLRFVSDQLSHLVRKDGYLALTGLAAGDYLLVLKDTGERITVRVADALPRDHQLLASHWTLDASSPAPLQITALGVEVDDIVVHLANCTTRTRCHLAAVRYVPHGSLGGDLGAEVRALQFREVLDPASVYLTGRNLGDEYRYILDRRQRPHFPGNMLERPGLILNPWALRETVTGRQIGERGGGWKGAPELQRGAAGRGFGGFDNYQPGPPSTWPDLSFLPSSAVVLTNLIPDADGVVRVPRNRVAGFPLVMVVALDGDNTVQREFVQKATPIAPRDLTLQKGLDPERDLTQQKAVTAVEAGKSIVIDDLGTADYEVYDSIQGAYDLYMTLSKNDPTLAEFSFICHWPDLSDREKRSDYSRYACHELDLFLSRKDPKFFASVIRPYLANKKNPTFMDRYLLGEDLSAYTDPWAYGRLNTLEQILLAGKVPGESGATARHIQDLYDLVPPNIEQWVSIFETALQGHALEAPAPDKGGVLVQGAPAESPALEAEGKPMAPTDKMAHARRRQAARPEAAKKFAPPPAGGKLSLGETLEKDVELRQKVRQFYRKTPVTKELAENNYYHVPLEKQGPDLIQPNAFWNDFAAHRAQENAGPFLSAHFAEATRNPTEMLCALAVLDLPFAPEKPKESVEDGNLTMTPGSNMVVFHQEIQPSAAPAEKTPILVSQNFFRYDDRYTYDGNERRDKYVTGEFLIHTVYACQVVVTNPTSSAQKLDVLLQIPRGAVPVLSGFTTRGMYLELAPYSTKSIEYCFYFPRPGEFAHYPVHVAREGDLLAAAPAVTLNVVARPTTTDTTSWEYISQQGTTQQVLDFLGKANTQRLDLTKIAWRFRDPKSYESFGKACLQLLARRHTYNNALWSFGIFHNDASTAREFLSHQDAFVEKCGSWLDSPLLTTNPVQRGWYQHLEYSPLVNARAHRFGRERTIPNNRFAAQYRAFMDELCQKPSLDDADRLEATYYLFLQDRVADALAELAKVDREKVRTKLQYDYVAAYADMYRKETEKARALAASYREYPVDRWRQRFDEVEKQVDEAEGKAAPPTQPGTHEEEGPSTGELAATEPAFDFQVEARHVTIHYQNLSACRVNYYLMDVEFLFSTQPFVSQTSENSGTLEPWAAIRPLRSDVVTLPAGKRAVTVALPEEFASSNVIVEVVAGGKRSSQAYYANTMSVQLSQNYGQLRVSSQKDNRPLPQTYVKVYARLANGKEQFYKDGYTDLRGRFDYAALSTGELDQVNRFSILVLNDEQGAVIREAEPPKQ